MSLGALTISGAVIFSGAWKALDQCYSWIVIKASIAAAISPVFPGNSRVNALYDTDCLKADCLWGDVSAGSVAYVEVVLEETLSTRRRNEKLTRSMRYRLFQKMIFTLFELIWSISRKMTVGIFHDEAPVIQRSQACKSGVYPIHDRHLPSCPVILRKCKNVKIAWSALNTFLTRRLNIGD